MPFRLPFLRVLLPIFLIPVMSIAKPRLVLDCDTANEIDDFYAIVRMLKQDRFEVVGLTSAQWYHYLSGERSVYASQYLNERLIRVLGRTDLPVPIGADEAVGRPWGGSQPKDSPAAQFIINQARTTPEDEKLYVVCTGASTNLASALILAPDIVPRIAAYIMGFRYDPKTGIWNKSEFNVRRDLNAADHLMNLEGLELHIMTATTSAIYRYPREETFHRQEEMGELGQLLTDRWREHSPHAEAWTMWDLALVQAMIHPELATEVQVHTPPENTERKVWVYDSINKEAMTRDYWNTVLRK